MPRAPREPKSAEPKSKYTALSPDDAVAIEAADEARLRKIIEEAGTAECSIKNALAENEDVDGAKKKYKELAQPFRDDMKRERQRREMAYERLEAMGKVE